MRFNADEVLEMAEQIERNGALFYRKASDAVDDAGAKELLTSLADWEIGHEKIFARMRKELSEQEKQTTTFDPYGEAALYIRAFSDGQVFDINEDPESFLQGNVNLIDILKKALDREKDAIVFFSGFKTLVPDSFGSEKIDKIINEEISHIGQLNAKLTEVMQQQ